MIGNSVSQIAVRCRLTWLVRRWRTTWLMSRMKLSAHLHLRFVAFKLIELYYSDSLL